jgi:hypothetical protein
METVFRQHPSERHEQGRWRPNEARSIHQDLAIRVGLVELAGLDLNPNRCPCRQPSDQDFRSLVVWKWSEQAALLEHGQPAAHFLLTPEADHPVLV